MTPKKNPASSPLPASLRTLFQKYADGTLSESFADWKWILSYARHYRWSVMCYIILGMLSTSLALAGSVAGKYLIDAITTLDARRLPLLAVLSVGFAIAGMALSAVIERLSAKLSVRISCDMQSDLYDAITASDWLTISHYPTGDLLNRFLQDVGAVSGNAISFLPRLCISLYQFAATFAVILFYDPPMALIALASAPILLLSSRHFLQKQRAFGQRVRTESGNLTAFVSESFHGIDTIKSFGITRLYREKLRAHQDTYRGIQLDFQWFSMKTGMVMNLLGMSVGYIAFGYCLWRLWTGDITYGTMTLFLQQRSSLTGAFNAVVGMVPAFLSASVSAHRLRELIALPREQESVTLHTDGDNNGVSLYNPSKDECETIHSHGITVTLNGIDFAYEKDNAVISASSMYAAPGEIVALVGASGEGKTTLIRLILGLIHPSDGNVTLSSKVGETITAAADTRSMIAYVPQGNTMFSGTVADNLRMVREDASDDALIAALKDACAWEFVSRMDGGLYAVIGERGKGLSEGQAQRIAIARALLRDAPVLLLDEATSALDVATERRVLRGILEHAPHKTVILTTHRPTVLSMCTRVYRVMDTAITALGQEESAEMAMEF